MMHKVMIRELSQYSLEEMADLFGLDSEGTNKCVNAMLRRGIIKTGAIDSDDNESDPIQYGKYKFQWVGIAVYETLLIVVYPKYYRNHCPTDQEMTQVLRVIRRTQLNGELPDLSDNGESRHEMLLLLLKLLDLYEEYGAYADYETKLQYNGSGDIAWERTIEKCQPFLSQLGSVYFDFETRESWKNESDYIPRLHRCLLTYYTGQLFEIGIGQFMELSRIELSNENLEDLGGTEYALCVLERKLPSQFVSWKREVLETMHALLMNEDKSYRESEIAMCLGTAYFETVWEQMCKSVFGDRLNTPLEHLSLKLINGWESRKEETLLEIIPRPQWYKEDGSDELQCGKVRTLKPDVVSILKRNENLYFCIYDAKYYSPILGEEIKGVPGVGDVTKQYLYQDAYAEFIIKNGFHQVFNAFLVPAWESLNDSHASYIGRVVFPGLFPPKYSPFADGISMWALSVSWMGDLYLHGQSIDDETLRTIIQVLMKTQRHMDRRDE